MQWNNFLKKKYIQKNLTNYQYLSTCYTCVYLTPNSFNYSLGRALPKVRKFASLIKHNFIRVVCELNFNVQSFPLRHDFNCKWFYRVDLCKSEHNEKTAINFYLGLPCLPFKLIFNPFALTQMNINNLSIAHAIFA